MSNEEAQILDLADFEANSLETAELVIEHPATGKPTSMRIQLLSSDSDVWKKQVMRIRRENMKYQNRRDGIPPEKSQDDALTLLAVCTVGWNGINESGQPLPCTRENAKRVYEKFPFIREQVDDFIGDRRNFLRS